MAIARMFMISPANVWHVTPNAVIRLLHISVANGFMSFDRVTAAASAMGLRPDEQTADKPCPAQQDHML